MLLKCCTQYASKFAKLSNGHRTIKAEFSFQSQRSAMTKNVQTTIQLHMLARKCPKSFRLGFSSMWTGNFQMYKMALEKAEEPEIKLPTSLDHWKSKRVPEKTSTFALLTTPKPLTFHDKLWKILQEMRIPDHLICLLRNLYAGQEET